MGVDMTNNFVELNDYPGYLIFENGDVFNFVKQKKVTPHPAGHYHVVYISNRDGKYGPVKRHRLVALAFVHNDDPTTCTEVNHKDGNTTNDHYANLEWVSPSQNRQHAVDSNKTAVNKSVKLTSMSGEVSEFNSIAAAASHIGWLPRSLAKKLRKAGGEVTLGEWTVSVTNKQDNDGTTPVVWRNLRNGLSGSADSLGNLAKTLGVSVDLIRSRLDKPQCLLWGDGYQFARSRNFDDWSEIDANSLSMFFERHDQRAASKKIDEGDARRSGVGYQVRWLDSGVEASYPSARSLTRELGVGSFRLSEISKTRCQYVARFKDRYFIIRRDDCADPWRVVDRPIVAWAKDNGMKPIEVLSEATGDKHTYPSNALCRDAFSLSMQQMDLRLKNPDKFYNGYSFKYIS